MGEMTRAPLSRGYLLDEYRIEKTLGGGGFSLVYLAYHIRTQTKVVIKEYLPIQLVERIPGGRVQPVSELSMGKFRMGMTKFFSEASALAQLKHPNIISVSNVFRSNNTVYMVMEYCQGRDLRWFIKRSNGKLDERFILTVFPQVLMGLRQLHRSNFLHLDIKPANILLRSGGRPMLLDFGAVQQVRPGERFNGVHTMTHGYAPLEQYHRDEIGPWTDLYALGATMYACITGKTPPAATDREKKDALRPLSKTHKRHYSPQLLNAIEWAMQLERASRPQDIDSFLGLALKGASESFVDKLVADALGRF